ncbi:MAG TPA: dienelactone hydrolase family protein [Gemmatimonadaceae bacterium]|nr:dienelactone hydrolase family protein [Gemmatimonadaceae bacterium]
MRLASFAAILLAACATRPATTTSAPAPTTAAPTAAELSAIVGLPPGADDATERVRSSPRHGEWAMIRDPQGDSVRAWVVFPERRDKAPVVVVIHEIFGLTTWIRGVADQLAAEGFIAVAPDFLSGKLGGANPDSISLDSAVAVVRTLDAAEVQRRIDAAARYGMALPAALPRYGVVGFCWGGSTSFAHAAHSPTLGAAVVYYGGSPPAASLAAVRAPVLGLYGGSDARVNATVPAADSALRALGRTFDVHTFEGAGHGFLRQQAGQNGANMTATREAWPLTVAWFRRYLGV